MRSKNFIFVVISIVLQAILLWCLGYESNTMFFIDGIPITRQTSFHMIMLGCWFLPIYFIVAYFSNYIYQYSDDQILKIIRYGRMKYYIILLVKMIRDLSFIVIIQMFISIILNTMTKSPSLISVIQYYIVLLIVILIENIIELIFNRFNINICMNIFILSSIIIYNFYSQTQLFPIRFINMMMIERLPILSLIDIVFILLLLMICILFGGYFIKNKDLLGEYYD